MDCSYVLQVRLRDLCIAVDTYAMLMDIPSRRLVPPIMTRRGRLGMVPWGRPCKREPRSTCSTTYPLRRSQPDHRGLSDAISYPIKGDDDGPVEATLADLSGSIRCDRRPDREADEGVIVAISTSSSGCLRCRSKDPQGLTDVKCPLCAWLRAASHVLVRVDCNVSALVRWSRRDVGASTGTSYTISGVRGRWYISWT